MNCGTSCEPINAEEGDQPLEDLEESNIDCSDDDSLSLNSFTCATKKTNCETLDNSISSPNIRKRKAEPRTYSSQPLPPKCDDLPDDAKYRRASSIMNSSYALLNYSTSMIDESKHERDTDRPIPSSTTEDHYASSFAKSAKILRQSIAATAQPTDTSHDSESFDKEDGATDKCLSGLCSITLLSTIIYLSAFSILGVTFRIYLAQLFDYVSRDTEINILFSDFLANMVGCFLMGFIQPSHDLDLLNESPMAILRSDHWFHSWIVVHIGLRTGLCGSLTTLSSWNTSLVVLMKQQRIFSALIGYIIGLETSLSSLAAGKAAAVWSHRLGNPHLAREEDILMFAYVKESNEPWTKRALPDYESRYLASLLPKQQEVWAKNNLASLENLERWKISTDEYRTRDHVNDETLIALHEIERIVLVDNEIPNDSLVDTANKLGWDVDSLEKFAREVSRTFNKMPNKVAHERMSPGMQRVWVSLPLVLAFGLVVMFGVWGLKERNASTTFYTTTFLATLFAPMGTLIRWKLSFFNGRLPGSWEWLPLGTLVANVVASVISIVAQGIMDSPSSALQEGWSTLIVFSAIQTGLAGCMSTVSTFVVEALTIQKSFPHHAKACYYMFGTLIVTCVVANIVLFIF